MGLAEQRVVPSVVFCVQEEVRADNRHTNGYNGQDHEHQQCEAVHVVDLVCPEGCENEVPIKENIFTCS